MGAMDAAMVLRGSMSVVVVDVRQSRALRHAVEKKGTWTRLRKEPRAKSLATDYNLPRGVKAWSLHVDYCHPRCLISDASESERNLLHFLRADTS